MKYVLITIGLFIFLPAKILFAKQQNPGIHFKIFNAGYTVAPLNWVGLKADTVFCFAIILTNKSPINIKFGHYTCGWKELFQPTSNSIQHLGYRCSGNYPTTTTLKPRQSCFNYIFLRKKHSDINYIQMVFNYIEGNSFDNYTWEEATGKLKGKKRTIIVQTYIKSNISKIANSNRIDFIDHSNFNRPEDFPYNWVGTMPENSDAYQNRDFKRYFHS